MEKLVPRSHWEKISVAQPKTLTLSQATEEISNTLYMNRFTRYVKVAFLTTICCSTAGLLIQAQYPKMGSAAIEVH